ncbi:MAG: PAS domain S-box protein [Chloroflexota bacterium]
MTSDEFTGWTREQLIAEVRSLRTHALQQTAQHREWRADLITTPLDTALDTILKLALHITGCQAGFIYVWEESSRVLRQRAATGPFRDFLYATLQGQEGLSGRAWRTGKPQLTHNYDDLPYRLKAIPLGAVSGMATFPIITENGQRAGVLGLTFTADHPIENHLEALQSTARITAVVIQSLGGTEDARIPGGLLEQVLRAVPDVIYVFDRKSRRIIYANQAVHTVLGYELHWLYEQDFATLRTLLDWETLAGDMHQYQGLIDGSIDVLRTEIRIRDKYRRWHWVDLQVTPLRINNDRPPAFDLGIIQDITRRKMAEYSQQSSERRLRSIFDSAPLGIAFSNRDGTLIEVNPAFSRMLGYEPHELHGANYSLFSIDNDLKQEDTLINEPGTSERRAYTIDKRYRRKDERIIWVRVTATLVKDDGTSYNLAIMEDITTQRSIQDALQASERRFRELIERLPMLVMIYQDNRVVYINPKLRQLSGFTLDDLRDVDPQDRIIMPEDDTVRDMFVAFDADQPVARRFDAQIVTSDGSRLSVEAFANVVTYDGRPALMISGLDATERRRAEQQQMTLALEQQRVAMLSSFVRDASHDFRTPLATINTSMYLLQRATSEERRERHINVIQSQIDHLTRLVDALLMLSQLDSGMNIEMITIPVSILLRDVSTNMQGMAREKRLTLTVDIPEKLPRIYGSMMYLHRALGELVRNAIAYTPEGGTITLTAYEEPDRDEVVISVTDTGVGIGPDELPRVFERFYRGIHSSVGGLGLGLSIARKLVEVHRGRIEATSKPDHGSIFTVHLPVLTSLGGGGHSRTRDT